MSEQRIPSQFTPVFDDLLKEHGFTTALVFGRVWRYCQMPDGICCAAQQRIADDLKISRRTVNLCLRDLVDAGYLVDTTPSAFNKPHAYLATEKAFAQQAPNENNILDGSTGGEAVVTEGEISVIDHHTGVSEDHTSVIDDHTGVINDYSGVSDDHTGVSENYSRCNSGLQGGVIKSYSKIDSLRGCLVIRQKGQSRAYYPDDQITNSIPD